MFKNPFVIEYRRVGVQVKEYALNLVLTEADKAVIELLGIERHVFLAERHLFLAGVLRSTFFYFDRKNSKREIRLALYLFDENLDLYFAKVRGLSESQQIAISRKIRQTYAICENPAELFEKFLSEITAGRYGRGDLSKFPGFAQLMECYMNDSMRFLQTKISKLN